MRRNGPLALFAATALLSVGALHALVGGDRPLPAADLPEPIVQQSATPAPAAAPGPAASGPAG